MQTPGARNASWPPAATTTPDVTPRTLQHSPQITYLTVEHCAAEPCTALQLLGHPKSYGIIEDAPLAPETPRAPHNLQRQHRTASPPGQQWLQVALTAPTARCASCGFLLYVLLASVQSKGAQRMGSQEQVQHQNAKSTKYREQQLSLIHISEPTRPY